MKTSMSQASLARLRHYGIDPKKSLGQNFLVDEGYLDRIVEAAELARADTVIEIGPGPGTLTARLAAQAGRVVAVELDTRLIGLLREEFAAQPQVTIVHGDILEADLAELAGEAAASTAGYKVVANLPYYITSQAFRHLLEARVPPRLAVLTVQKEVAQRIVAGPGEMSLLALSVQFYAVPRLVATIPAGAFVPRPKVDSAVIRLDVRPAPAVADVTPEQFFRAARAGFGQKRKQLLNSLSGGLALDKGTAAAALEAAGVEPTRRAETLSLQEWGALARALPSGKGAADGL
jgi:16S rRNA (adenine1518-N6/adenine1519-N6)-dimethyltransferase